MIQLVGDELYQWDTGRIVQIESDSPIHEVHFTTRQMDFAYVVETYNEGENTYCAIPNVILQSSQKIYCYAVKENSDGEETVSTTVLSVNKRNRPDDYVYTEPERLAFKELEQRIDDMADQIETVPYVITGTQSGSTSITLNDFSWEDLCAAFEANRPVFIIVETNMRTSMTHIYTLSNYKEVSAPPYANFTRSANGHIYTLKVTSEGSTSLTSHAISVDETLTVDGAPADAKIVGDKFTNIEDELTSAVSTKEQALTYEQKKQARENIGAVEQDEFATVKDRVAEFDKVKIHKLTDTSNGDIMWEYDFYNTGEKSFIHTTSITATTVKVNDRLTTGSIMSRAVDTYYLTANDIKLNGKTLVADPCTHKSVHCYLTDNSLTLTQDKAYLITGDDVSLKITHADTGEVLSIDSTTGLMCICGRVGDTNERFAYGKFLYVQKVLGVSTITSRCQPIYGDDVNATGDVVNKYTAIVSWKGAADVVEL